MALSIAVTSHYFNPNLSLIKRQYFGLKSMVTVIILLG